MNNKTWPFLVCMLNLITCSYRHWNRSLEGHRIAANTFILISAVSKSKKHSKFLGRPTISSTWSLQRVGREESSDFMKNVIRCHEFPENSLKRDCGFGISVGNKREFSKTWLLSGFSSRVDCSQNSPTCRHRQSGGDISAAPEIERDLIFITAWKVGSTALGETGALWGFEPPTWTCYLISR